MYPRQLRSDQDADGRLDEQALGFTQPLFLLTLLTYALADLRTCLLTYSLTHLVLYLLSLTLSLKHCVAVCIHLLRLFSLCDA